MTPCQCCQREIDGMNKEQFGISQASYGHENCTSKILMEMGIFSEKDAENNCACFRVKHEDYTRERAMPLPEELVEDIKSLKIEEEKGQNKMSDFAIKYRTFSPEMLQELIEWAIAEKNKHEVKPRDKYE